MAGDSLYQAWFKAHHTAKFYEVAITHYQEKNKKDKIDALVKEALKFYGYKLGNYEFGKDNRRVNIDEKTKIIYPNLSSVKGFGENVVNTLYELGKNEYNNFVDLIRDMKSESINKTVIDKLIKINYFKKFGEVNKLLKITEYFDLLDGAKQMSKKKIIDNGLTVEFVSKYGNETEKQVNKIDSSKLLNDLIDNINEPEQTLKQKLDAQYDVLGILTYINKNIDRHIYYVSNLDIKKSIVNITLYECYSGNIRNVKMWKSSFDKKIFNIKDLLYVYKIDKKHKRVPSGEYDINGKQIWVEDPNELEYWLSSYTVNGEYIND